MQLCLLDTPEPGFDSGIAGVERFHLDGGGFVDYRRGWVRGHQKVFDQVREACAWSQGNRRMYRRRVDVPRLMGRPPGEGQDSCGIPFVDALSDALSRRYGTRMESIAMALYRDGNDSVAWHADKLAREDDEAIIAIVVLGEPRPFMLRPKEGGPSMIFSPGWGDLLVMGGSCQRTHEHCVPKVKHAGPRMSIMFRDNELYAESPRFGA